MSNVREVDTKLCHIYSGKRDGGLVLEPPNQDVERNSMWWVGYVCVSVRVCGVLAKWPEVVTYRNVV